MNQKDVKLPLLAADMVIYTENPENPEKSTKQLQELSSNFRKASEYHVSIQKSVTYLYISSKQLENKIVKFLYNSTIKYLGINLTKNT